MKDSNGNKCSYCETELASDARYCHQCGCHVQPDSSSKGSSCASCGQKNLEESRYCESCGAELNDASIPEGPAAQATKQHISPSEGNNPCPDCGNMNTITAKFCGGCGQELSGNSDLLTASVEAPGTVQATDEKRMACQKCGRPNVEGSNYCGGCGAKLDVSQPSESIQTTVSGAPTGQSATEPIEDHFDDITEPSTGPEEIGRSTDEPSIAHPVQEKSSKNAPVDSSIIETETESEIASASCEEVAEDVEETAPKEPAADEEIACEPAIEAEISESIEKVICIECGESNPEGFNYCDVCGASLTIKPEDLQSSEEETENESGEAEKTGKTFRILPKEFFEAQLGTSALPTPAPAEPMLADAQETDTMVCPGCRCEQLSGVRFCTECGEPLSAKKKKSDWGGFREWLGF